MREIIIASSRKMPSGHILTGSESIVLEILKPYKLDEFEYT